MYQIGNQHLELVTNTFCHQCLSPTSTSPFFMEISYSYQYASLPMIHSADSTGPKIGLIQKWSHGRILLLVHFKLMKVDQKRDSQTSWSHDWYRTIIWPTFMVIHFEDLSCRCCCYDGNTFISLICLLVERLDCFWCKLNINIIQKLKINDIFIHDDSFFGDKCCRWSLLNDYLLSCATY